MVAGAAGGVVGLVAAGGGADGAPDEAAGFSGAPGALGFDGAGADLVGDVWTVPGFGRPFVSNIGRSIV